MRKGVLRGKPFGLSPQECELSQDYFREAWCLVKKRTVIFAVCAVAVAAIIAVVIMLAGSNFGGGKFADNSEGGEAEFRGNYYETVPNDEFRKDNLSDF